MYFLEYIPHYWSYTYESRRDAVQFYDLHLLSRLRCIPPFPLDGSVGAIAPVSRKPNDSQRHTTKRAYDDDEN